MSYLKRFQIRPHTKVNLKRFDPAFHDRRTSPDAAKELTEKYCKKLADLQYLLYAQQKHSLLIVLQAMDTGGKDGVIRHVLSAMNPLGCRAVAFKAPTALELSHDFLWRIHRETPAKGEVVIFNRSHYEDVLVVRVHNLVPKPIGSARYDQINAFEEALADSNTHVLKFFLHISKREQLKRLEARLDSPAKNWKVNESDYEERPYWKQYMSAYSDALSRCSTKHAPWFVVPADHKWFRDLAIAQILIEYLQSLRMKFPTHTPDIKRIRRRFHLK